MQSYKIDSIVIMKKQHPCGENLWQVTRVGADIKIKCMSCGNVIMMTRSNFEKNLKQNLSLEKNHS